MNLEELKSLFREYHVVPNKLLGQNFLVDFSIFPKLGNYSELSNADAVLDAGAGFGFLTQFLAGRCKSVLAVEKDPQVAKILRQRVKNLGNVSVMEADVLKANIPFFNKVVSIPPYYLSSEFVVWLLSRSFDSALLIVQKEFAERLVAPVGSEGYSWLTVVSYQQVKVDLLDLVPSWMFYPEPEVESIILRIRPWQSLPFTIENKALFLKLTKWLFTQRNKKLGNALVPFIKSEFKIEKSEAQEMASTIPRRDNRVRELSPEIFGEIANVFNQ